MRLEGSNQVSYSNALHAQYQRMQYELVKAADATKTGVSGTEKTIWVQVKGDHLVQVVSVKPKE